LSYTRSFTAADDVCLVVKDMGVGTFYRGQTAEQRIAQLRKSLELRRSSTSIRRLTKMPWPSVHGLPLPGAALPGRGFRAAHREAMACGLPVIVTGYGPALDFCTDSNACLVPARMVRFPEKKIARSRPSIFRAG